MSLTSIKRGLAGMVAAGGLMFGYGCGTSGLSFVDDYFYGGSYIEDRIIIIEDDYDYYDDDYYYYDDGFDFGFDLWW